MIQNPTTPAEYRSQVLRALAATGIRQLAPGGKARALVEIVADKIGQSEAAQFYNISQTMLPYATGASLDALGQIYGVTRLSRQDGRVYSQDQNFRFYVRQGTFGSLNSGQDISIPSGTRIFTLDDDGPVYVTDSVVLPASATEKYFSARAVSAGSAGAGAAGVFVRHNFSSYTAHDYGSLLVTNDYGVIGGRDEEDDESYRYRIYLKLRAQSSVNESALRFELLQIPGIQDIVFEPYSGGFYCYVYGISPVVPPSLTSLVQIRLNEKVAFPMTAQVLSPDLVGVTLGTTLTYRSTVAQADREQVKFLAVAAAEEYINNLAVGEMLVINEIADRIRNADDRILDVGVPNRQIAEIFLWRSRADSSRYSRYLLQNYPPALGERVIVEPITAAISLV